MECNPLLKLGSLRLRVCLVLYKSSGSNAHFGCFLRPCLFTDDGPDTHPFFAYPAMIEMLVCIPTCNLQRKLVP